MGVFQACVNVRLVDDRTKTIVEQKCFFHGHTPVELFFLLFPHEIIKVNCGTREIMKLNSDVMEMFNGNTVDVHYVSQEDGKQSPQDVDMKSDGEDLNVTVIRHQEPVILAILFFEDLSQPLSLVNIRQQYLNIDITTKIKNIYSGNGDINFDEESEESWLTYVGKNTKILVSVTLLDDVCCFVH